MSTSVRLLQPADLAAVADLHRVAFPDYRSTRLGSRYCCRMLQAYAAHPDSWVAVARSDAGARPIGYLVAAPPEVQRALNRSLRPWAALALASSPRRLGGARRAAPPTSARSLSPAPSLDDGTAGTPEATSVPATIRVVLIGTDPSVRGVGVGATLLADFARRAAAAGHEVADLTVAVANRAARLAYARAGWTEVGVEGDVAVRCRLELGPTT